MLIREATIEDSASLAHIQVDSYRVTYVGMLPQDFLDRFTYEEQEQDWRDLMASGTRDRVFVAEDDAGEIVGYALGRPEKDERTGYDGELVSLHVRKSAQGQGVGRLLIAAVAGWLRGQGCASMMLWTLAGNPARRIYEHLGGELIGEKTSERDDGFITVDVAYGWKDIEVLGCGSADSDG